MIMRNYVGYHGTSKNRAQKILSENYEPRRSIWFGKGIYFFKDDYLMAKNWAEKRFKENPSILKSNILCNHNEVLDLTDPTGEDTRKFHTVRKKEISKNIRIRNNRYHHDEIVINFLYKEMGVKLFLINTYTYQEYDNHEDKELRVSSRIPNGTEMVVKENSIIINTREVV